MDFEAEINDLKARVTRLEPIVAKPHLEVTATPGAGFIDLGWAVKDGGPAANFTLSRDGVDTDNTGPWSIIETGKVFNRRFDRLVPGFTYILSVSAVLADGTFLEKVYIRATPLSLPPVPSTDLGVTWQTGAWTQHDLGKEHEWNTLLNRPMDVGAVHVTHGGATTTAQLESPWPLGATRAPKVSIAIPMALSAGVGQDLSASMLRWANQMKVDGRTFYIRLGWEMNLMNNSRVSDLNLQQWRARWSKYYDIFKSVLGQRGLVGFNPNDGANQSGLSGSIMRAWVAGKVDWCGPDIYDWYPPFKTATQISDHFTKFQGLDWWAAKALEMGVKLGIPEWGPASGTQHAGNTGGDNPIYVEKMYGYFRKNRANLLFENYFNESAPYLKSDILIPQLPLCRAEVIKYWRRK